jgi:protein-tyrosine phosphatase
MKILMVCLGNICRSPLAQGILDAEAGFWIQDKGELEIASTIWLSIMDNTKVKVVATRDAQGNIVDYLRDEKGDIVTVNAFEAYKQNDKGEIIIREDVDWDTKREAGLKKTVWAEVMRTQGNYAMADRTKVEAGWKGRALYYYRKYLEPSIRNRIGRLDDNYSSGAMAMGYWNGLIKTIKYHGGWNTFKSILGFKEESTGVNDFYQMKSQMAAREFATVAILHILGLAIKGAVPDDDEDDRKYMSRILLLNMVNIYAKVQRESSSLVPIPILGGLRSYIETLGEFSNANKDVARIAQLLEHGIFLIGAQFTDSEYWHKKAYYQKKYGPWEAGDAKIKKTLYDMTGWMNIFEIAHPELRYRIWKQSL